jgi:hypothetical protein
LGKIAGAGPCAGAAHGSKNTVARRAMATYQTSLSAPTAVQASRKRSKIFCGRTPALRRQGEHRRMVSSPVEKQITKSSPILEFIAKVDSTHGYFCNEFWSCHFRDEI